MGLAYTGQYQVDFMVMPFIKRPTREVLFPHRPAQFEGPDPKSIAKSFGSAIHSFEDWQEQLDFYDYFIVCGSNLIEEQFANCGKILNVHAGLIPESRGLDSFKWAIEYLRPIGNTLHIINADTDMGEILYHLRTPLFPEDDLATFAERHYFTEIWMLQNFEQLIRKKQIEDRPVAPPSKRMPLKTEAQMVRNFENYKEKFAAT